MVLVRAQGADLCNECQEKVCSSSRLRLPAGTPVRGVSPPTSSHYILLTTRLHAIFTLALAALCDRDALRAAHTYAVPGSYSQGSHSRDQESRGEAWVLSSLKVKTSSSCRCYNVVEN